MRRIHLVPLEKFILILVIIMLATGFILFLTNYKTFLLYVQEDGIVEWLTVAGLLAGCFTSVGRLFKLFRRRNWWFLLVTFLLALMLFFAAGDEISWGQRIFGIKSSEPAQPGGRWRKTEQADFFRIAEYRHGRLSTAGAPVVPEIGKDPHLPGPQRCTGGEDLPDPFFCAPVYHR